MSNLFLRKRLKSLCSIKCMNNTSLKCFILRNSKFFEVAVKKMRLSVVHIFSWDISFWTFPCPLFFCLSISDCNLDVSDTMTKRSYFFGEGRSGNNGIICCLFVVSGKRNYQLRSSIY